MENQKGKKNQNTGVDELLQDLKRQVSEQAEETKKKTTAQTSSAPEPQSKELVKPLTGETVQRPSNPDPVPASDPKQRSKIKLQEFLDNTKDIYSGAEQNSQTQSLFEHATTHTETLHKIKQEDVDRFRKFTIAESQVIRYQQFKKVRSAKAEQFVLSAPEAVSYTHLDVYKRQLSTCSYEFEDARTVLVARKVREGESSDVDVSRAARNNDAKYPAIYQQ